MLWRALSHVGKGFYIDVGAQDPLVDSVSLAFYEHGWRGIHVVPTPFYAEALRQARPEDVVIQAAVGAGPTILPFFEIPGTGISTADPAIAEQHRQRGFDVKEITVSCLPLSAILEARPGQDVHWLKIDVEGFEEQVLGSWGTCSVRPWIVVVESTLPLTQIESHGRWEPILVHYGYDLVYFDGLNRYYVCQMHSELKGAFLSPPNVFDNFRLNGTASAPFHTLLQERLRSKTEAFDIQIQEQTQNWRSEVERLTSDFDATIKANGDRELSLLQRLADLQKDANLLEGESSRLNEALLKHTDSAKREIEDLSHRMLLREHEFTAQILAISKQAANEHADLRRHNDRQMSDLRREHCERERVLRTALDASREDFYCREQGFQQHIQTLRAQAFQAHKELEDVLREMVKREQAMTAQLHTIQEQAKEEKRNHEEQASVLRQNHLEREQALQAASEALRQNLYRREQDFQQHTQLLLNQASQAHGELEDVLREMLAREQTMTVQLLAIQKQADDEKATQELRHSEQTKALRLTHTEHETNYLTQVEVLKAENVNLRRQLRSNLDSLSQCIQAYSELKTRHNSQLVATGQRRPSSIFSQVGLTGKLLILSEEVVIGPAATFEHEKSSQDMTMSAPTSSRIRFQPEFTVRPDRKYDLEEFTSLFDRNFVRCAYLALLQREPDLVGEEYYLRRLRSGVSKHLILWQILQSPEARQHSTTIRNLKAAVILSKAGSIPVFGRLLLALLFLLNIGNHMSDLRAIENHIVRVGEEIQNQQEQVLRRIIEKSEYIDQK